ncbi:MAG: carbamoyltransferase HypF [Solirubrobacteraceae bacterium]
MSAARVRTRARVEGTVQGVGFRPFVYRIAREEGLAGYVLNDEHGVLLEVEGPAPTVARFVDRLTADAPPLAAVDRVSCVPLAPNGEHGFQILASEHGGAADALVTPDTATCSECLAELVDPADRRHRYPFINCTNCGPRFTIVRGVPYDRPLTTMAKFSMCGQCRREYEDPLDRRFHAQPNACPRCGPRVRVLASDGLAVDTGDAGAIDPIQYVAKRLAAGYVVAVKGLGGFHLVCDAGDERAVNAVRTRKHREDKPFALMVSSVEEARKLVELGDEEERLMSSPQRPIVLAPRLADADIATGVAPGAPELGLMLPYTPLHHLLLADFGAARGAQGGALVMTSGNVSDEPIAYRDEDALARLAPIADLLLVHDREIETRTDDSVVRVVRAGGAGRRALPLRRSRGYVPAHVALALAARRPLLACGAEQKNTFCVAKGSRAWVSHHVGDLEYFATLEAFCDGVAHFERLFAVTPELIAHDLHPRYLSTAYALEREGVDHVGVQHHHAHLAACLAEHGVEDRAVGAIYDGTGYGTDGTVWGGELLVGGLIEFERAGSLWPVRMPGAAAAIRQPWRMAFAWLAEAFAEVRPLPRALSDAVDPKRWEAMAQIGASASVSPVTSSIGRLFDAVGALCGLAAEVTYEGQAAVELEAAAWTAGSAGEYEITRAAGGILDPRAAIRTIAGDLERGVDPRIVSARFHAGVAAVTVEALASIASEHGLARAVLSGGVFQNRLLLETVAAGLERAGLEVLIPERLPPNDGGISYGQAAIAAARDRA